VTNKGLRVRTRIQHGSAAEEIVKAATTSGADLIAMTTHGRSGMGRLLFAVFQERGIVATRHLATGTHLRTQRPLAESGAIPTGVLLGHVRAGTQFRGVEHRFGHHRIGVVVYFQHYGDLKDIDVHLPVPYASVLADLYERAGLDRHDRLPNAAAMTLRHDEPTAAITVQHNRRADVSAVRIAAALDARISAAELAGALEHRAEVA